MELTELKFKVVTDDLDTAITKINKLSESVKDFNKAQDGKSASDREAAAAAKAVAKEQKDAAKAAEKAAAAQKKAAEAAADVAEEMSPVEKLLQKLNNQYGDLVAGFTKGEAAILQQARSFGLAESELKPFIAVLEKIKELTKDPFDASIGSIRSVTQEFDRLQQRANLTAQGISLTTKQLAEYSRLSAEVAGQVRVSGLSPTDSGKGQELYNRLLAESQKEYLDVAASVNKLEMAEKERNNALRESERLMAAAERANATMMDQAVSLYQRAEQDKARALQVRMQQEATAMDQAVALFQRAEQDKARAAEAAANRIKNANMDALSSAQRLAQITSMVRGGMSESEATKRVDLSARGVELAAINKLIAAENELEATRQRSKPQSMTAALNESAKAAAWLEAELHRVDFALQDVNKDLLVSSSNRLVNFEKQLRKAGITGDEAKEKLDAYRASITQLQKATGNKQVDYLSRALGPQITDIFVGLATGQSPMMVLLQQGGQLRDQFALAGVAGADMGKMLVKASTDMVASITAISSAVGQLLVSALVGAGKQITGLVTGPIAALITGFKEAELAGKGLASGALSIGQVFSKVFSAGTASFLAALPLLLSTSAAAAVAFGVAQYQIIQEEGELSKALALSGGALGLSKDAAIQYAMSLNAVGISTSKGIEVLIEMAKAGNLAASGADVITKAAVEMEKYAGVAIKDTVKAFSEMKEKPVEALAELAIKTGMVRPEVLELVASLKEQGEVSEAAGIATKALADVTDTQVARIRDQLHPLEALYKNIGEGLTKLWNSIGNAMRTTDAEELSSAYERLNRYIKDGAEYRSVDIQRERILISQITSRMRLAQETARSEQINSEIAKDFLEKQKLINEQEKIRAGLDEKKLTRTQAMNKAEADARKRVKNLSEPEIARIRETAGMQWDVKHKNDNKKAQNELNAALEAYIDIQNKAVGVNSSFNNEIDKYKLALKAGLITTDQYAAAVNNLIKQQPFYIKQQKEITDAAKEEAKAMEVYNDLLNKSSGFTSSYNNELAALDLLLKNGKITWSEYEEASFKLLQKQPYYLDLYKKEKQVQTDLNQIYKDRVKVLEELKQKSINIGLTIADILEAQDQEITNARENILLSKEEIAARDAKNKIIKATNKDIRDLEQQANDAEQKLADLMQAYSADEFGREDYRVTSAFIESQALRAAAIKARTEATIAAEQAADTAARAASDNSLERLQAYKTAMEGVFNGLGDAIADFAATGKQDFGSLVTSMINDLIRFELRAQASTLFKSMGGFSGIADMLLNFITPVVSTGVASGGSYRPSMGYADGGSFYKGIQQFATGGAFTNSIVDSPTMFKFAKGTGLMGEAGPEAIMPLRRDSSGSLGVVATQAQSNVEVTVNNYSTEKATAQETIDSRGNRRIEVTIGDMNAAEMSRSGSSQQKALSGTYGVRPQLIRR